MKWAIVVGFCCWAKMTLFRDVWNAGRIYGREGLICWVGWQSNNGVIAFAEANMYFNNENHFTKDFIFYGILLFSDLCYASLYFLMIFGCKIYFYYSH